MMPRKPSVLTELLTGRHGASEIVAVEVNLSHYQILFKKFFCFLPSPALKMSSVKFTNTFGDSVRFLWSSKKGLSSVFGRGPSTVGGNGATEAQEPEEVAIIIAPSSKNS